MLIVFLALSMFVLGLVFVNLEGRRYDEENNGSGTLTMKETLL